MSKILKIIKVFALVCTIGLATVGLSACVSQAAKQHEILVEYAKKADTNGNKAAKEQYGNELKVKFKAVGENKLVMYTYTSGGFEKSYLEMAKWNKDPKMKDQVIEIFHDDFEPGKNVEKTNMRAKGIKNPKIDTYICDHTGKLFLYYSDDGKVENK